MSQGDSHGSGGGTSAQGTREPDRPPTRLETQLEPMIAAYGTDEFGDILMVWPPQWRTAGFSYLSHSGRILVRDAYQERVLQLLGELARTEQSPAEGTATPAEQPPAPAEQPPAPEEQPPAPAAQPPTAREPDGEPPRAIRGLAVVALPDQVRARFGREVVEEVCHRIDLAFGRGVAAPDHLFYAVPVGGGCPATEPEPVRGDSPPYPGPSRPCCGQVRWDRCIGAGVRVSVLDSGWLVGADQQHAWLEGVTGEDEAPDTFDGSGQIRSYAGHGTFIAGVVRTIAPGATVHVSKAFRKDALSSEFESHLLPKVEDALLAGASVLSLSFGTYTRENATNLGFDILGQLIRDLDGVVLVAAAGNDHTTDPFYPAAFPWAVSVGALNRNGDDRAWFSNHGPWVQVYAPGEDVVNAYVSGVFVCKEPENIPQNRTFCGMARWSGTSFSTPVVSGMIARRMAETGESAPQAARALVAGARWVPGVGRVVLPFEGRDCCPRDHRTACHCRVQPGPTCTCGSTGQPVGD